MSKFFMTLFVGVFMLSLLYEMVSRTSPVLAESLKMPFKDGDKNNSYKYGSDGE